MALLREGAYYIRSIDSATGIDVTDGCNTEAEPLAAATPNNASVSQQWLIVHTKESDTYTFQNMQSGTYVSAHFPDHHSQKLMPNVPMAPIGSPIASSKAIQWKISYHYKNTYSIQIPGTNMLLSTKGLNFALKFVTRDNGARQIGFEGMRNVIQDAQLFTFIPVKSDWYPPVPPSYLLQFPLALPIVSGTFLFSSSLPGQNLGLRPTASLEGSPLTPVPADPFDAFQQWEVKVFKSSMTVTIRNRGCNLYVSSPYYEFRTPFAADDGKVPIQVSFLARHWSLVKESGGFTLNIPATRWLVRGRGSYFSLDVVPGPVHIAESKFNWIPVNPCDLEDGTYRIVSISQGSLVTGTATVTATGYPPSKHGFSKLQEWTVEKKADGLRTISKKYTPDCHLAAFKRPAGKVTLAQRSTPWLLDPVKEMTDTFFICTEDGSLAMELAGNSPSSNTDLVMKAFTGNADQMWRLEFVRPAKPLVLGSFLKNGRYRLKSSQGTYLSMYYASRALFAYKNECCPGNVRYQEWDVVATGDSYDTYTLKNVGMSKYFFNVRSCAPFPLTGPADWVIAPTECGRYYIYDAARQNVLELVDNNSASPAALALNPPNGSEQQKWAVEFRANL